MMEGRNRSTPPLMDIEETMASSDTVTIRGSDIADTVANALQYISCYHPQDYVRHLAAAYEAEASPAARNAIAQILVNSRMAAFGRRPICQDTGLVVVFAKVGMQTRIDSEASFAELVDAGVRQAYLDESNPLRPSIVADPLFLSLIHILTLPTN
jgi:fumarate hydratase, class I